MVHNNAQSLITGFLPFLGETINPSQQLAEQLGAEFSALPVILPVKYSEAWPILKMQLEQQNNFSFCLMLGQAGGRRKIGLERCALNIEHADVSDEAGVLAQEKVILVGGQELIQSPLPLVELKNQLVQKGHPVEVSHSAGTFVCNSLYYQALSWAKQNSVMDRMLFVHVPHLPSQAGAKFASSGLELSAQMNAIRDLLKLLSV